MGSKAFDPNIIDIYKYYINQVLTIPENESIINI